MTAVKIITKQPCPYCENAKRLLKAKDVNFELVDLTENMTELERLKKETGWKTVPMIYIGGKMIGGYSDLKELDESGELDRMLKA